MNKKRSFPDKKERNENIMKTMKKAIAAAAALAMLFAGIIPVSARIDCYYENFASPIKTVGIGNNIPAGTYASSTNPDIQYIFTYEGSGPYAKWSNGTASGGVGSLILYGWNSETRESKAVIKIGKKTDDNKYIISFDKTDPSGYSQSYLDYVTLNEYEHNGKARINSNSVWTVTDIGNGSNGSNTWKHYEATLTTIYEPEIDIAAHGWGRIYIDNIMVKDTAGNILFSENFETDDYEEVPDTPEPTVPYKFSDFGLYQDGKQVDEISSDGEYTARAVIKNYTVDEGVNAQIIAVLRKDGKRVDAAASDLTTVSVSKYFARGTVVQTQITVGDLSDGEYELSAYLWDGLGSMKILLPHKTIGEAVE